MDPFSLIVGVLIFIFGVGTGRAMGAVAHSRQGLNRGKDPERCTCKHMRSFHDKKGCHAHSPNDWQNSRTCRCTSFVSEAPELLIDWSGEIGS